MALNEYRSLDNVSRKPNVEAQLGLIGDIYIASMPPCPERGDNFTIECALLCLNKRLSPGNS